MTKGANDNVIMTINSADGLFWHSLTLPAYCYSLGTEVPSGVQRQLPWLGVITLVKP